MFPDTGKSFSGLNTEKMTAVALLTHVRVVVDHKKLPIQLQRSTELKISY